MLRDKWSCYEEAYMKHEDQLTQLEDIQAELEHITAEMWGATIIFRTSAEIWANYRIILK